jgi:hypothetical protein
MICLGCPAEPAKGTRLGGSVAGARKSLGVEDAERSAAGLK